MKAVDFFRARQFNQWRCAYDSFSFDDKKEAWNDICRTARKHQHGWDTLRTLEAIEYAYKWAGRPLKIVEMGGYTGQTAEHFLKNSGNMIESWCNYDICTEAISSPDCHSPKYKGITLTKDFSETDLPEADLFMSLNTVEFMKWVELEKIFAKVVQLYPTIYIQTVLPGLGSMQWSSMGWTGLAVSDANWVVVNEFFKSKNYNLIGGHSQGIKEWCMCHRVYSRQKLKFSIPDYNTVSVVIPTSGRATLKRTLDSVLPQCCLGDEVWVVADGVRPDARAIVEKYPTYSNLKYAEVGPSCFYGVAQLNYGFAKASGDYIYAVGDDDMLTVNSLETIRARTKEFPGVPLFFRFSRNGKVHAWKTKQLKVGIGAANFVFPNLVGKVVPILEDRKNNDYTHIVRTLGQYPPESAVWLTDITYAVGGNTGGFSRGIPDRMIGPNPTDPTQIEPPSIPYPGDV